MKPIKLNNDNILPFRFKKMKNGQFFISNDWGDWLLLEKKEFLDFVQWNKVDKKLEQELIKKGFLQENFLSDDQINLLLAGKWANRYNYMFQWPALHIIVVTLACNQTCKYCHASAKMEWSNKFNLTKEKAKKIVDVIFETTAGNITIEFQWGEPLLNWDTIKDIIEYSQEKNKEYNLNIEYTITTNLTLMDDEKISYLMENKVIISTSLDGPAEIHDWNRPYLGWSSFEKVSYWIKKGNNLLKKYWLIKKVWAITTVTRKTLKHPKKLVDTYIELWLDSLFVRPLNPYGFAAQVWDKIWYSQDEYNEFYRKLIKYIEEKRKEWVFIKETYIDLICSTNLNSIHRLNYMEERGPMCGATLWEVAYNWDGKIYTCDEGRMLAATWDYSFQTWEIDINKSSKEIYNNMILSNTTKAMTYASSIDSIPGYNTHPYSNYIWLCPIYSYTVSGNIFGKYKKENRFKLQEFVYDKLINRPEIYNPNSPQHEK